MPRPPILRTPPSTLDLIFYVRGGKFQVLSANPRHQANGALPPVRAGTLPAPVVIKHRLPETSQLAAP